MSNKQQISVSDDIGSSGVEAIGGRLSGMSCPTSREAGA